MRKIIAAALLLSILPAMADTPAPVRAAAPQPQQASPLERAITFRLGQCDVQSAALEAQADALRAQIDDLTRRLSEAEAKTPKP